MLRISLCVSFTALLFPSIARCSECSRSFSISREDFEKGEYKQVEEFIAEQVSHGNTVEIVTTVEVLEFPSKTTDPDPTLAPELDIYEEDDWFIIKVMDFDVTFEEYEEKCQNYDGNIMTISSYDECEDMFDQSSINEASKYLERLDGSRLTWLFKGRSLNCTMATLDSVNYKLNKVIKGDVLNVTIATTENSAKGNLIGCSRADINDCDLVSYTFKERNHKDYVQYIGSIPSLNSFTACAWVSPAPHEAKVFGSLFNYCVGDTMYCNTIFVLFKSDRIDIRIQNKAAAGNSESITSRSHFCIVKSMTDKRVRFFINGTEGCSTFNADHVPAGGILILGQDQDGRPSENNPGLIQDSHQGFTGTIQNFYLWDRPLNQLSMKEANCSCPNDFATSFHLKNSKIEGHVAESYAVGC